MAQAVAMYLCTEHLCVHVCTLLQYIHVVCAVIYGILLWAFCFPCEGCASLGCDWIRQRSGLALWCREMCTEQHSTSVKSTTPLNLAISHNKTGPKRSAFAQHPKLKGYSKGIPSTLAMSILNQTIHAYSGCSGKLLQSQTYCSALTRNKQVRISKKV